MSWNRRIVSSKIFFELMKGAGFECHHHGKCVYSFYRRGDDAFIDEYHDDDDDDEDASYLKRLPQVDDDAHT